MLDYIPGFKIKKMTDIRRLPKIRVVNSGPGIPATKRKLPKILVSKNT